MRIAFDGHCWAATGHATKSDMNPADAILRLFTLLSSNAEFLKLHGPTAQDGTPLRTRDARPPVRPIEMRRDVSV